MREEAGSGPHWPHALGLWKYIQLSPLSCFSVPGQHDVATGLAADLDCVAPAAQLHEWGSLWRWGARKLTVHLRAPASGGDGVHVGRVLHPLLGWDPWQLGRRSFSFCLLIMYFLRLAPQTCGLTWDCTQLCGSPLSESSGL